jgi:hypothetical protein
MGGGLTLLPYFSRMTVLRVALIALETFAIVGCQNQRQLPNGYSIWIGDRGKMWLRNPDQSIALAYVKAVGHDGRMVFTETRKLRESPPYGFAECQYQVTDTVMRTTTQIPATDSATTQWVKDQIRRTRIDYTSRSCIYGA